MTTQFLNIIKLDEVDSTNNYLKTLASKNTLEEGTLVTTNNQNSGRGQTGNIWVSEPNKNITCSLYLKPVFLPVDYMFMISKIISIGLVNYLNTIHDNFCIKWPNDIYYNKEKIGGILVENQIIGNQISQSIIGIGLNINQKQFPESLPNANSLAIICKKSFNIDTTTQNLMHSIASWYNKLALCNIELIDKTYRNLLFRKEGYHNYREGSELFKARIKDIEPDGLLILETQEKEIKEYYFKEVEFVL